MIYLVDSAIQLLKNRGQENPGSKYKLYKSWENLAADQSFERNLMKGGSELTKLRQSCSWKQVHSKKIQNSYHISPPNG